MKRQPFLSIKPSHLKFAIIGCGRIAERHAPLADYYGTLTVVCDTDKQKADALAFAYVAKAYYSVEELAAAKPSVDVVVICTPNGLHAEHTIRMLHLGYHVLVEKPMALTSEDCEIMMQAAAIAKKNIYTVMQNRFNAAVQETKQMLDTGAFGRISSVQLSCLWNRPDDYYQHSWHGTKDMDGGILFTQFSHFIDILHWFFGEVKHVKAITRNAQHEAIAFEDCGTAILEFKSGVICSIHFSVNSFRENREGSLTILGENGIMKIGGRYLNTIEYRDFEKHTAEIISDGDLPNEYISYQGSSSNHDLVYGSLVRSLVHGETYYASPYEGLKTVELIERIYEAVQSGQ